jgi:hypothetical protein
MTRINCIDPALISDKHLGAEYRELPRIFNLVRDAIKRGESPSDRRNPSQYTLGTGHCRFFYSRLGYLQHRQRALIDECKRRGRAVNYSDTSGLLTGIPTEWLKDWTPTDRDVSINIDRINQRGGLRDA